MSDGEYTVPLMEKGGNLLQRRDSKLSPQIHRADVDQIPESVTNTTLVASNKLERHFGRSKSVTAIQFDDTDDDITFNVDRRVVSEADADDEMCVDNLKDAGDCVDDVSNVHERVADQKSKN